MVVVTVTRRLRRAEDDRVRERLLRLWEQVQTVRYGRCSRVSVDLPELETLQFGEKCFNCFSKLSFQSALCVCGFSVELPKLETLKLNMMGENECTLEIIGWSVSLV